jgi:hypothetical protein
MNAFHIWIVDYHHSQFFPIKFLFIKKFLNLVLYKIDFGVLKFKSPLLRPKINLMIFLNSSTFI